MEWSQDSQKRVEEVFGPSVFLDLVRSGDSRLPSLLSGFLQATGRVHYYTHFVCQRERVGSAQATEVTRVVETAVEKREEIRALLVDLQNDLNFRAHQRQEYEESMSSDNSGLGND